MHVVVQPCGCIALPEALAAAYGMLPGAVLAVNCDDRQKALTLAAVDRVLVGEGVPAVACPVRP